MDTVKQQALNHCITDIVNNMAVEPVIDHLRVIITDEEAANIDARPTRHDKSRMLIDTLRRKHEEQKPFERLKEALSSYSVGQGWLAKKIGDKYEELRRGGGHRSAIEGPGAGVHPEQPEEEFDPGTAVEEIIRKFEQLTKVKQEKLDRPLADVLVNTLNDSRRNMSTRIDLQDLVNIHMNSVLPDAAIKAIRKAPDTSDAFFVFCEALTRSSVYAVIIFLIGLKSTKQRHLFHLFCTQEFCNDLMKNLNKC